MKRRIAALRAMAHSIEYLGTPHRLAIAEISPDRKKVDIRPFSHEVHSTPFFNGTVTICRDASDGALYFEI